MIKEWCEQCEGKGFCMVGVSLIKHEDCCCKTCQGKGYTELEPDYILENGDDLKITNASKREVYIKEVKE